MEDALLEITRELREAAMAQVADMKENEVSRRWFTTAMRSVVLNEEHVRFKGLVHDLIGEKIDYWQGVEEEFMTAQETYTYGLQQIKAGRILAPDDYAEILVAKIFLVSLEPKVDWRFGRNVDSIVREDDEPEFADDIIVTR